MKKILITGASGYLGSSFINSYYKEFAFEKFSLLKQSIEELNFQNIEVVLHCAALVHKSNSQNYSYEDFYRINADYTYRLAKEAKQSKVGHFVFISTIAIYGDTEDTIRLNTPRFPKTNYGKSKLEAENLIKELNDDNFKVTIVRPSMIYGENAPGNIDSLIKLINLFRFVPLGQIKNKRTFVSINNLTSVLKHIIINEIEGEYLVSDDEPISTSDLILNLSKSIGRKIYLFKVPFLEILLKLLKPGLYQKLFTDLVVDNSESNRILNYKTPNTVYQELNKINNNIK